PHGRRRIRRLVARGEVEDLPGERRTERGRVLPPDELDLLVREAGLFHGGPWVGGEGGLVLDTGPQGDEGIDEDHCAALLGDACVVCGAKKVPLPLSGVNWLATAMSGRST